MENEPVFNYSSHVQMWDWLSKNPMASRHEWPGWLANGGDQPAVVNLCFACGYDSKFRAHDTIFNFSRMCSHCPFGNNAGVSCLNGLMEQWRDTPYVEARVKLATQIRDLPVRQDIKTI